MGATREAIVRSGFRDGRSRQFEGRDVRSRLSVRGLGVQTERRRGRQARREEDPETDAAGAAGLFHPAEHPNRKRFARSHDSCRVE